MPSKKILYECKYCGKEYADFEECAEHEESHLRNYSIKDTKEIVDTLRQLSESAWGWYVGGKIAGIPVSNFVSLMNESADRLEKQLT